jgi:hypothetical protein
VPEPRTLDDTPIIDADPAEPDSAEPEPDEPAPPAAVEAALPDPEPWAEPETEWPHQWLQFEGDRLAVRKPTQKALAGLSLGSGPYISDHRRNSLTGLFMMMHMSEATWWQVFYRLVNPDEEDYTIDTIGELVKQVIELSTNSDASRDVVKDNGRVTPPD